MRLISQTILLLFILTTGIAQAEIKERTVLNMSHDVEYFVDANHETDISDISLKTFKKVEGDVLNFGNNKATIWCRFKLNNDVQDPILHLKTSLIEEAILYIPQGMSDFSEKKSGYTKSFQSLDYQIPNIYFNIETDFNDERYFYIKIDATYLQFWVYSGTSKDFIQYIYNTSIIDGIYYGIILIMILYNLIVFFTVRDSIYLYYVLYVLFVGFMVAHFQGHDAHLWGEFSFIAKRGPIWPAFGGLTSVLFAYNFLKIKTNLKILQKTFYLMFSLWCLSILSVLFGYNFASSLLNQTSGLLCIITFTYSAITLINKGHNEAKLFLLGWGGYMTTSVYFVLCGANIFQYTLLTDYAWQIGSTFEMLVLSIAVGQKINTLKKEKHNLLVNQNKILEDKVSERTEELKSSNEELNAMIEQVYDQHNVIKKKNQDLNSSISYAQRIQRSVLPPSDMMDKYISDYFVFYQPKDVVSGDIYWFTHHNGHNFLAAIDCTGHGVPGAFVSLLAVNIIKEIVTLKQLVDPSEILDAMAKEVEVVLNQKQNKNREGMDMGLCVWKSNGTELKFSGAKNPLYISRQDGTIEMIKGDKKPIGGLDIHSKLHQCEFTTHTIEITPDILNFYILSDGIQDQFGGPNDKKFSRKRLQELLNKSATLKMFQQKDVLDRTINTWKKDYPQIDDMLLIGFRP
ncbi:MULTISPECIES: 7TM diverse intracellular signaling domain-containing protein [Flammeovirga]|uniref:SpoIIE family protein phosphatase n=1 Tax=Flammeovirga agarivorans TaxID=2726742 RepID=A0A7X8SK75_9BACT|nr:MULTISPECIES: 7TM diverse intracellular signaling domain-containing protein [Flammeovirga]NLR91643.1 SpoIIE family protein phosphatase [Flammeovirga agarivorans]